MRRESELTRGPLDNPWPVLEPEQATLLDHGGVAFESWRATCSSKQQPTTRRDHSLLLAESGNGRSHLEYGRPAGVDNSVTQRARGRVTRCDGPIKEHHVAPAKIGNPNPHPSKMCSDLTLATRVARSPVGSSGVTDDIPRDAPLAKPQRR